MPFAAHRLRSVFEAQSELGFMAWSYATSDSLAEVLAEGYFSGVATQLRPGDLVFLGINPPPALTPWSQPSQTTRRCLLMVAAAGGRPRMRLVQDYGGPDDPSPPVASEVAATPAAAGPVGRRRGRG